MKRTALATILFCVAQSSNAMMMSLDFTAQITNTTNSVTGESWNYGVWDQWADINSSDIFVGAALTGSIWIDTDLSPADSSSYSSVFDARTAAPTIDAGARWLSLSLNLNGNEFNPATMARPAGERTANSDPGLSSDANQWITSNEGSDFWPSSLELFDDWDTEFDGIIHDRQLRLEFSGCAFQDQMFTMDYDFSSCLADSIFNSAGGNAYVRVGSGSALDNSPNVAGFEFDITSIGQFSEAGPLPQPTVMSNDSVSVPEPSSIALFALGLFGLGFRRLNLPAFRNN